MPVVVTSEVERLVGWMSEVSLSTASEAVKT
jgi:hypothetical protein